MTYNKAQATIELNRRPDQAPRDDVTGGLPLGRGMFRLRNVASFLLASVVLTDEQSAEIEAIQGCLEEIDPKHVSIN